MQTLRPLASAGRAFYAIPDSRQAPFRRRLATGQFGSVWAPAVTLSRRSARVASPRFGWKTRRVQAANCTVPVEFVKRTELASPDTHPGGVAASRAGTLLFSGGRTPLPEEQILELMPVVS